jgi:hypothetical protein
MRREPVIRVLDAGFGHISGADGATVITRDLWLKATRGEKREHEAAQDQQDDKGHHESHAAFVFDESAVDARAGWARQEAAALRSLGS